MEKKLKESIANMHLLTRSERTAVTNELLEVRPDFLKDFGPKWWWFKPCVVNVLLVCDGGLNFGPGGFGLSEFITSFNKLEQQSFVNIKYKVTLAHRSANPTGTDPMHQLIPNSVITDRKTEFHFVNSVNLKSFDQVWLFGILGGTSYLDPPEVTAIGEYMDGGGGLFATGDHGSLGGGMCGNIPRVKDMRLWANTSPDNAVNEVSMTGGRRNDTNRPGAGQVVSNSFNNQSDNIPQTIAVRTFGSGLPHPLLSIKPSLRPSGIIDIMPDHPHEGECAEETVFIVNGHSISTQVIATSFVLGGSTAPGKVGTNPHCFPSIAVFDGRPAKVGRIAIDSTWHHFVNINLNGVGSPFSGLDNSDFEVVRQYYMNISRWITRSKVMICKQKYIVADLLKNSQLIEASLNNPAANLKDISLADLNSIGMLAMEILSDTYNPAFAREFMIDLIEPSMPALAERLDIWKPASRQANRKKDDYYQDWINFELITGTALGAGFIALRDAKEIASGEMDERSFDKITNIFQKGVGYGLEVSIKSLNNDFRSVNKILSRR